ncbi:MAG: DUF934 domain-containing protein [Gammaproteobacteria bacterium]|nr:DUF934 domain-containing protein [Gammaproteobacteria bacterium]
MSKIIRDRKIVNDNWVYVDDETALPAENSIITYARWQIQREQLIKHSQLLGIKIPNDVDVTSLQDDLAHFALIVLDFPLFRDGRAYSQAYLLRNRYGFNGEIRAGGNVLRDQLQFMERCGFNAFENDPSKNIADLIKGFDVFTVQYQPNKAEMPATRHMNKN